MPASRSFDRNVSTSSLARRSAAFLAWLHIIDGSSAGAPMLWATVSRSVLLKSHTSICESLSSTRTDSKPRLPKRPLMLPRCMKTSMQGGHRFPCSAGRGPRSTVQLTATRPPGRSTRWTSRKAARLSGQRQKPPFEMTTSAEAGPRAVASMSATTKLHCWSLRPRSCARVAACCTSAAERLTPTTRPRPPTFDAARNASGPKPLPRSTTVSPGRRAAEGKGLRTPCMRSTSSPRKSSSC
mmetsp:Transcript_125868/g.355939  ORF Transcript_125868/g.355939 Transcript_125868/m.355939 type:complete len:240 (-) Transcript_125868:100-819(-)